jgi:hypothetical protein
MQRKEQEANIHAFEAMQVWQNIGGSRRPSDDARGNQS